MKNKFFLIKIYLILSLCFFSNLNSEENFFFNVSEIEISQNGNLFKGSNSITINEVEKKYLRLNH